MGRNNGSIWREYFAVRPHKRGEGQYMEAPEAANSTRSSHLTRQQTCDDPFESDCDRVTRIKFVEKSRLPGAPYIRTLGILFPSHSLTSQMFEEICLVCGKQLKDNGFAASPNSPPPPPY